MAEEKLHFSTIKESRKEYFVEYSPPIHDHRIANLQLIIIETTSIELIAQTMEKEAMIWIQRFPIPVMVSSFDNKGDLIHLNGTRTADHLISFYNSKTDNIENHWQLLKDDEIPSSALNKNNLLNIYKDIEYKSSLELKAQALKDSRKLRFGWYIVFVWVAVVPAIVLILEFFSPVWLAVLILIYSLFKALINALKLLGKWKKTPDEIRKENDERRMKHHHYYCEKNPEGFMRLRADVIEKEQKESILQEATILKNKNQ